MAHTSIEHDRAALGRIFPGSAAFDEMYTLEEFEAAQGDLPTIEAPCYGERCPDCGKVERHADSIMIAIDGACRGNGRPDTVAAYGIFFAPRSPYNKAVPVTGTIEDHKPENRAGEGKVEEERRKKKTKPRWKREAEAKGRIGDQHPGAKSDSESELDSGIEDTGSFAGDALLHALPDLLKNSSSWGEFFLRQAAFREMLAEADDALEESDKDAPGMPDAILVVDAGIEERKYNTVRQKLRDYVSGGGTAVFCGVFSGFIHLSDLGALFRTEFGLACAIYVSDEVAPRRQTPAAWAKVGKGWIGYIGDVNGEEATDLIILAMCGL
ncbi:hypothetical protein GTA08_BOTSDO13129 [Botryosphaeria dothidea]|uniref:Uncharacterized protein n=1 Tax=Botryosphaeria dothidea TaxID=55169 RepID=A0A8H4J1A4_9PEZI|nr:hypothetical protein GTA08_BOTSDO13129 [Botryosphaeria dothidea]